MMMDILYYSIIQKTVPSFLCLFSKTHITNTKERKKEKNIRVELSIFSFLSFSLVGIGDVTQQLTMAIGTTMYTKANNEEKKKKIDKPDKNTLSLLNEQSISRNNRQCQQITTSNQRKKGVKPSKYRRLILINFLSLFFLFDIFIFFSRKV
jgi:hypothetical protein